MGLNYGCKVAMRASKCAHEGICMKLWGPEKSQEETSRHVSIFKPFVFKHGRSSFFAC
jgi:hypothetical protein